MLVLSVVRVTGVLETGWLLEKVIDRIRRFVVMSDDQALAVGLWVLHTWVIGATDTTPYLDVSSPVKQCGKTRLFEVLELLVNTPQFGANHTEATLFRSIEADRPTLLLDEIDRTFGKDAKLYAGIVGVLNAGYRRGATIPRMVGEGKNMKVKNFAVFGPKAFAGIGQLPDTVADRSIPIRLNRKSKADRIHRFRYAKEKLTPRPSLTHSRSGPQRCPGPCPRPSRIFPRSSRIVSGTSGNR